MAISTNYICAIEEAFNFSNSYRTLSSYSNNDFSSISDKFLCVSKVPITEIPIHLLNNPNIIQYEDSIILPLFAAFSKEIKGASSIIRTGFTRVPKQRNLLKVNTPNGKTYYINKGIILDKNLDALFITTVNIKEINEVQTYDAINVYISPKVFTNIEDTVCKEIVTKILPVLLDTDLRICGTNLSYLRTPSKTFPKEALNVIIKDYKIETVKDPSMTEDFNSNIREFINNNKNYISESIREGYIY